MNPWAKWSVAMVGVYLIAMIVMVYFLGHVK
jgi:hypothetical protein